MVRQSHSSARIFAVLALAVALSGCGGGDDDGGRPAATPTATTAPVATETAQVAATITATVRPTVTRTEAPPPSATATVERTPTETVAPSETPVAATPTATRTATQVPTTTGTSVPTTPPTLPATATLTPTATPTNPVLENPVDETIGAVGLPAGTAYIAVDSLGMPHIYGDDQPSILFVQGYQTAKERFWQMDAFRRVAEGRLSELFGTLTFDMDVEMRTIFTTRDGRRIEQALWDRLQADAPEQAVLAQAYTNGINAWLADLRAGRNGATLPAEYTLVGFTGDDLDDWRPQDSLAIGRLQAFSLSSTLGEEIEAAEIAAALPEALRLDIFRSAPGAPATVLPVAALEERTAESRTAPQAPQPPLELLHSVRAMLDRLSDSNPFGSRADDVGSNNWIVAPSLSANGHAMLANDPHLQLFNPAIWHMVQLDAGPGFRATGVNFPGLPGIILGHNDFGAWGATVAVFDVTDVYVEEVTTPPEIRLDCAPRQRTRARRAA